MEVQHFARQMGLKLSAEEAAEAVGEMELATKKDGMVEFDEFWHWSVLSPPPPSVPFRLPLSFWRVYPLMFDSCFSRLSWA